MPLYQVETSPIEEMTYEDVMELQENLEMTFEVDLDKSISVYKEPVYNLEYEELQDKIITRAVIYYEDKEDYVFRKEDEVANNTITGFYILEILFTIMGAFEYRKSSDFKFSDCVNKIIEEYKPVNKDEISKLTKKLELKRDEYNRLKK